MKPRQNTPRPHTRILFGLRVCLGGLIGALGSEALAEETAHRCLSWPVSVFASSPELADRVCDVFDSAEPALTACGLPPHGPLSVYVVNRIEAATGHCLGVYLCESGEIAVVGPEALERDSEMRAQVYSGLGADDLFDSLIVHELTHARLSSPGMMRSLSVASQEYIAYAMQIASLPEATRDALLKDLPVTSYGTDALNEITLAMAPRLFIASVWEHFWTDGHGCAFVRALIDGSEQLGLPLPE